MTEAQIKAFFICTLVGIAMMYNAIRKRKIARKIQDTPRSKISTAPQGYVELEGFAWPVNESSKLPSGREVVYYSLQIQRLDTKGSGKKKRKEWVTVFSHMDFHPFYLVDPTGLVKIDFSEGKFEMDASKTRRWGRLDKKEQERISNLAGVQKISGFPPSDFLWGLFSKQFRVIENEIFVGSPIYLHGDFRTETQEVHMVQPQGLSDFHGRVFNESARSQKNLNHLLDKNGDGKVSHEEAQAGYSVAASMARKKVSSENNKEFQVFGTMGSSQEHKLLIADTHETHLVQRMNRGVAGFFVGGALLITVGIIQAMNGPSIARAVASVETAVKHEKPKVVIASLPDKLHQECVGGEILSCVALISRKTEFELSDQHVTYYTKRACDLGDKTKCK